MTPITAYTTDSTNALPLYVLVFWLLRERHTWVTCREW